MKTKITKAQQVEAAFDDAWDNGSNSEGCYALAVAAAIELGGAVEFEDSNDNNSSKSFAPSLAFVFEDSSAIYVTCSGVYLIG